MSLPDQPAPAKSHEAGYGAGIRESASEQPGRAIGETRLSQLREYPGKGRNVKAKTRKVKRPQKRVKYDAAGLPLYLTELELYRLGACQAQMAIFRELYPSGTARVTRHNLRWAARRGLRIMWIVRRLGEVARGNPIPDVLQTLQEKCEAIKQWFRKAKSAASAKRDKFGKDVPAEKRKHKRDTARRTRRIREADALADFLSESRKIVRNKRRAKSRKTRRTEAKFAEINRRARAKVEKLRGGKRNRHGIVHPRRGALIPF
jgi:hypothetical protein